MRISEVSMGIMSAPQGYNLVNAISADLIFEYGLPSVFEKTFNISTKIKKSINDYFSDMSDDEEFDDNSESKKTVDPIDFFQVGDVIYVENVINIVIKKGNRDRFDKAEIMNFMFTLKEAAVENHIQKIAIPRLFTGKNGMDWNEVRATIEFVFRNTDIDILVCVQ